VKKRLVVLSVMILVCLALFACRNTNVISDDQPFPEMSVYDMFQKYGRADDLNKIQFVSEPYNEANNSVRVYFNGHPVTMKVSRDASYIDMGTGMRSDMGNRTLDARSYTLGFENQPEGTTYYVFLGYAEYSSFIFINSRDNLLVIDTKKMPDIVNPNTWDGTCAEIEIWTLPENINIVENLSTNEVVIDVNVFTHNSSSNDEDDDMMALGSINIGKIDYERAEDRITIYVRK